jgi:hypothetical protein
VSEIEAIAIMRTNAMSKRASLINAIRQRPAMYFGGIKSLTALYHFLGGFQMACGLHGIENDGLGLTIPHDFCDWVAYRTHFRESTSGWCNMIVSTAESEEVAFDRFFELLEEHFQRVPTLVAEILSPISNTRTTKNGKDFLIPPPKRVQLVKYTDDPGFFALHESEDWTDRFHPYLCWMSGLNGGQLAIHDEESYGQMIRESEQWEREVIRNADETVNQAIL